MTRNFSFVCSFLLAAALSQNKQVRLAERGAPDSTRYQDREVPPKTEHLTRAWDDSEINAPDGLQNAHQYDHQDHPQEARVH
jgi:hypothetical protein